MKTMEKFNEDLYLEFYETENRFILEDALYVNKIEYRRDPLTGIWVRINRRLNEKHKIKNIIEKKEKIECPFCKENIFTKTPKLTDRDRFILEKSIAFPSLYPYAKYHFVLVPNYEEHIENFSDLKFEDFYNSMILIKEVADYVNKKDKNYKYLFINLNKGPFSGASQEHLHFQIIIEDIPRGFYSKLVENSEKYFNKYKSFLIEDYINFEKNLNKRYIKEDKNFVLISPFAPIRNNEILGMIKSFGIYFMSSINFREFLLELYRLLKIYENQFENFNLVISDTSYIKEGKILPFFRVGQRNQNDIGFLELYHGEFVVGKSPEDTAKFFRVII
ncbi:MAG: DUF4931 domain-containing protein [Nanopusillaceae archaeon]